jgi:3-dehydroquinate synthase
MSRRTVRVALGDRSYDIHIGPGLVDDAALYAPHVRGRTAAVVTNETVAALHAQRVEAALGRAGARTLRVVLPDGEAFKDWQHLDRIFTALLEANVDRKAVLVAVGGGVVGDMAGFAAAAYQRGIAHIQVPTTLLAQVDSSVGGKTAINHPLGKNMIGAFHQPSAVIADTSTLATLPPREYAAGLAEVVKYGAIHELAFLDWIEAHAGELSRRREAGARALLNFGHTFGHAIESAAGYGTFLHGEAVAMGMALAARLSARLGRIPAAHAGRLAALLERFGLPVAPPPFPLETWLTYMGRDKKNHGGRITLVLLDALGRAAVVRDTPESELRELLA